MIQPKIRKHAALAGKPPRRRHAPQRADPPGQKNAPPCRRLQRPAAHPAPQQQIEQVAGIQIKFVQKALHPPKARDPGQRGQQDGAGKRDQQSAVGIPPAAGDAHQQRQHGIDAAEQQKIPQVELPLQDPARKVRQVQPPALPADQGVARRPDQVAKQEMPGLPPAFSLGLPAIPAAQHKPAGHHQKHRHAYPAKAVVQVGNIPLRRAGQDLPDLPGAQVTQYHAEQADAFQNIQKRGPCLFAAGRPWGGRPALAAARFSRRIPAGTVHLSSYPGKSIAGWSKPPAR